MAATSTSSATSAPAPATAPVNAAATTAAAAASAVAAINNNNPTSSTSSSAATTSASAATAATTATNTTSVTANANANTGANALANAGQASSKAPAATATGVYANPRLMHACTTCIGSTVHLQTKDGRVWDGVFYSFSPEFTVCLKFAVQIDPKLGNKDCFYTALKNGSNAEEEAFFDLEEIVKITALDVDLNYATKEMTANKLTTDADISGYDPDKSADGGRQLESWQDDDGDTATDALLSLDEMANKSDSQASRAGWGPQEMFSYNERVHNVTTTYNEEMTEYTVPVPKQSNSKDWRKKHDKASAIAREIGSSQKSQQRLAKEDGSDCEEEKFSAVLRPVPGPRNSDHPPSSASAGADNKPADDQSKTSQPPRTLQQPQVPHQSNQQQHHHQPQQQPQQHQQQQQQQQSHHQPPPPPQQPHKPAPLHHHLSHQQQQQAHHHQVHYQPYQHQQDSGAKFQPTHRMLPNRMNSGNQNGTHKNFRARHGERQRVESMNSLKNFGKQLNLTPSPRQSAQGPMNSHGSPGQHQSHHLHAISTSHQHQQSQPPHHPATHQQQQQLPSQQKPQLQPSNQQQVQPQHQSPSQSQQQQAQSHQSQHPQQAPQHQQQSQPQPQVQQLQTQSQQPHTHHYPQQQPHSHQHQQQHQQQQPPRQPSQHQQQQQQQPQQQPSAPVPPQTQVPTPLQQELPPPNQQAQTPLSNQQPPTVKVQPNTPSPATAPTNAANSTTSSTPTASTSGTVSSERDTSTSSISGQSKDQSELARKSKLNPNAKEFKPTRSPAIQNLQANGTIQAAVIDPNSSPMSQAAIGSYYQQVPILAHGLSPHHQQHPHAAQFINHTHPHFQSPIHYIPQAMAPYPTQQMPQRFIRGNFQGYQHRGEHHGQVRPDYSQASVMTATGTGPTMVAPPAGAHPHPMSAYPGSPQQPLIYGTPPQTMYPVVQPGFPQHMPQMMSNPDGSPMYMPSQNYPVNP